MIWKKKTSPAKFFTVDHVASSSVGAFAFDLISNLAVISLSVDVNDLKAFCLTLDGNPDCLGQPGKLIIFGGDSNRNTNAENQNQSDYTGCTGKVGCFKASEH
jgi:hypothetical protein